MALLDVGNVNVIQDGMYPWRLKNDLLFTTLCVCMFRVGDTCECSDDDIRSTGCP